MGWTPPRNARAQATPPLLANVYSNKTKEPLVQPYTLLERTLVAKGTDGRVKLPIKIGVIDRLYHPGIMNWDKRYLKARSTRKAPWNPPTSTCRAARQGADIVVALHARRSRHCRPLGHHGEPGLVPSRWRALMPW